MTFVWVRGLALFTCFPDELGGTPHSSSCHRTAIAIPLIVDRSRSLRCAVYNENPVQKASTAGAQCVPPSLFTPRSQHYMAPCAAQPVLQAIRGHLLHGLGFRMSCRGAHGHNLLRCGLRRRIFDGNSRLDDRALLCQRRDLECSEDNVQSTVSWFVVEYCS